MNSKTGREFRESWCFLSRIFGSSLEFNIFRGGEAISFKFLYHHFGVIIGSWWNFQSSVLIRKAIEIFLKKSLKKAFIVGFFSLGFLFNFGIQYLQRERSYPFQIFTSPTWRNYRVLVKFSELYLDRKGNLDIFKKPLKRREMMVVIFSRTETNYCSNGSNLFSFS